jgi:hypothetical protein
MDPRLFLPLAGTLAQTPGAGPAECRTSISRCYYAAYHVAVSFLDQLGIEPRSGPKGHSAVKNGLLNSQDAGIIKYGSDLDTLHSERLRADYDLADERPEDKKTAQALVQQSGRMIADLDACRRSPARRTQVQSAIKEWVTTAPGDTGLRIV